MQTTRTFLSRSLMIAATIFVSCVGTPNAQTPAFPNPVVDDNGHYGFVREVVPILLGRKPSGAREVKVLGDLVAITDRATVIQMLMETDEFVEHWADTFLDMLRLQRAGPKRQRGQCFDSPMRSSVSTTLAAHVGDSVATNNTWSSDFNMKDLALAAFRTDRIDALQRAYLYPLAVNGGRLYNAEVYKTSQGADFSHTYLNRSMACFGCHNEVTSTSNDPDWDRHWQIEIFSDKVLFGSSAPAKENAPDVNNVFRPDQVGDGDDDNDGKFYPWGIHSSCAQDTWRSNRQGFVAPSSNNAAQVEFAGESGNDIGVFEIDEVLRKGISQIKSNGLQLVSGGQNAFPEPTNAEQAMAFTVAVATVNMVWSQLMGENLTLTNYFPRNKAQRDALWNLTTQTFLPRWSVKAVIQEILLSHYTARKSPELSTQFKAYKLPMIIDPWVARDPRGTDPDPVTELNTQNGQGEIVRAHAKRVAMKQASTALGFDDPTLFGTGRYSSSMQLEFGQFLSTSQPGLNGFDIQSLLTWEDTNGLCQNSPWMNNLMAGITSYNDQNPLVPLTLLDVVKTMRDWLLQDASLEIGGSMIPDSHELAALAAIFSTDGQPLAVNTPVSAFISLVGSDPLRQRFDRICGAYVSSPQFLLSGISLAEPLEIPDFKVCNGDPDSCSYQPMCEEYREVLSSRLNTYVQCNNSSVVPEDPPEIDPPFVHLCQYHDLLCDDHLVPACLEDIRGLLGGTGFDCPVDIDRCDPRCGSFNAGFGGGRFGLDGFRPSVDGFGFPGGGELGLPCCGGRPDIDLRQPDDVLSWLEGALILEVAGVEVINLYDPVPRVLERDQSLKFGDVLALKPGARLVLKVGDEKVSIGGRQGVPSIFERTNSKRMRDGLQVFSKRGDNRVLRKLFSGGLSSNAILPSGESLLTWAVRRGDAGLLKDLLARGADVNLADAQGNTPVVAALQYGQRRMLSQLRDSGAQVPEKWVFRKTEKPHQIMVTGPSAAKAPHPAGEKFFSSIDWRDLKVDQKQPSVDETKRAILKSREVLRKRSTELRDLEATDQDVIVPFPEPEDVSKRANSSRRDY